MKKLRAAFFISICSFAFIFGCTGEQGNSSLYLPINSSSNPLDPPEPPCTGTSCDPVYPGPSWVTATKGNYTDKVGVDWALVEGATSYKVYRNTGQTGTFTRVGAILAADLPSAIESVSAQSSVLNAALAIPEMRAAYEPGCLQAVFQSNVNIGSGINILPLQSFSIILQVGSRSRTVSFLGGLLGNRYSQSEIVDLFNNALGDYGICEPVTSDSNRYVKITANERIILTNGFGILEPPLKKFLVANAGWLTVVTMDPENTCPGDITPPTVSSITPAGGATGVSISTPGISVTFSEAMAASTVTASSFTLTRGATSVAGSVTAADNTTFTFVPSAVLLNNTTYTATVSTAVTDSAGNHLATSYSWSFATTPGDVTAPTVSYVTPANGTTGVSISAPGISFTFSEAMAASTVTSGFTLSRGGISVAGSVTTSNNITFAFAPSAALLNNTTYTATITTTVTDGTGNHLAAGYSWSFTTTPGDVTAPTVLSVSPASGATDVSVNATVTVSFSEAVLASTVNTSSFRIYGGGAWVSGTVLNNTFTPSAPLSADTVYSAFITTDVTDLAGNHMAEGYTWSFTTEDIPVPDTTPPTVVSVNPVSGAAGVSIGTTVAVSFSETVDSSTVNASSFTLTAGGAQVSGTVAENTFTPSVPLASGTTYTATITTDVTDLAGNPLAEDYTWSFSTEDAVPPAVASTSPANGANGVSVNTALTVSFSEPVLASTVNTSSFTLFAGTSQVSGTVSNNTFTPSAALAEGTTYTATISTAVTDLAGNHLAGNYTWSFTTATSGPVPSHYFIDEDVTQGTYYYYVVTAIMEDGKESKPSPVTEGFALSAEAPGNVPGLTATMGTYTDRVVLTWQAAERADLYTVFRTNGTTTVQVGGDITGTAYTDTTVLPGLYKYQVVAWTSLGVKGGSSDQVLGYRGLTATEFCYEAYKEIGPVLDWLGMMASENVMDLLSDQSPVAGMLGGTFQYDCRSVDYIGSKVTARIVFTDYSNYYLTLNDYMQIVAKTNGTGTITETISVTGIYNGTIQFVSVPFTIDTTDGSITFSGTDNLIVTLAGGSAVTLNATILNQ